MTQPVHAAEPFEGVVGRQPNGVVVRPDGSGPATWAMGWLFERLVSGEESDESLGASLVTHPPGIGTPSQVHTREAEAFFVLGGTMTYQAEAGSSGSQGATSSPCRWAYPTLSAPPEGCRCGCSSIGTPPIRRWKLRAGFQPSTVHHQFRRGSWRVRV